MDGRSVIRPRSYFIGAAALIIAGVVLGLGLGAGLNLPRSSRAANAVLASTSAGGAAPESPFVGVVEKTLPAVVFIDVTKKAGATDDPNDEFMRRFFGDQFQRKQQRVPSSGSGFIIDSRGYILTNNHVVRDADDINVTLNDQRSFKAKLIGADPETDVAVIKIDAHDLPSIPLGDSDRLRVGDWAIAIGNPLGELRGSVTVGIVSAEGRTNLNIYGGTPQYQDFIQTDASINFGNSGGPLCNIRGEAIGINTAINTSGQGIGFAVPINLAHHIADQLMAHGSVKAGLKRNDVIVEFNGQPVSDMQKLRLKVADTAPGSQVHMIVLREGARVPVTVTLVDKDDKTATNVSPSGNDTDTANPGGLSVRDLREDERRQLNVESGVRVTDVADGSEADRQGIQPNDVIEMVGNNAATDAVTFKKLMLEARKSGRPATLLVNTNGNGRYLALRLDK